jgi:hypothetical protein
MIGVLGFDSRRRLGIFLFTTASRTALGPIQPPIQWVSGALSLGVKRPGREADHSPPSSAEVKNAWSYTSTTQYAFMAWCSVKSTGTTLRLPFKLRDILGPHAAHCPCFLSPGLYLRLMDVLKILCILNPSAISVHGATLYRRHSSYTYLRWLGLAEAAGKMRLKQWDTYLSGRLPLPLSTLSRGSLMLLINQS